MYAPGYDIARTFQGAKDLGNIIPIRKRITLSSRNESHGKSTAYYFTNTFATQLTNISYLRFIRAQAKYTASDSTEIINAAITFDNVSIEPNYTAGNKQYHASFPVSQGQDAEVVVFNYDFGPNYTVHMGTISSFPKEPVVRVTYFDTSGDLVNFESLSTIFIEIEAVYFTNVESGRTI